MRGIVLILIFVLITGCALDWVDDETWCQNRCSKSGLVGHMDYTPQVFGGMGKSCHCYKPITVRKMLEGFI